MVFITLVVLSTAQHMYLYGRDYLTNNNEIRATSKLGHFSIIKNAIDLISFKKGQDQFNGVDLVKISMTSMCVLGHSVACSESPYGFYIMGK